MCGNGGRGQFIYYPRIAQDLIKWALENQNKAPTQINPLSVRAMWRRLAEVAGVPSSVGGRWGMRS